MTAKKSRDVLATSYKKALVLNDLHIPFSCLPAVELALDVGDVLKPDRIFLDGDIIDCWEISNFIKNPLRRKKNNLVEEIAQGREWLHQLRRRFPKAEIIYILGNHEYRWIRNLATNAPELAGLRGLSLAEQLGCPEEQIEVIDSGNRESSYQWKKLLIGHFNSARKHSGYTARGLIEDKGISLIQAHCHRGGASFKRHWDRDIVGYENFCLCDRNPEYVDRPNWQLGFCNVYMDNDSDFFYVEPHPITEIKKGNRLVYRTWFDGRIYQR